MHQGGLSIRRSVSPPESDYSLAGQPAYSDTLGSWEFVESVTVTDCMMDSERKHKVQDVHKFQE